MIQIVGEDTQNDHTEGRGQGKVSDHFSSGLTALILKLFLIEEFPEKVSLFNYHIESEPPQKLVAGEQSLVMGQVQIRSRITRSRKHFSFAALQARLSRSE